MPYKHQTPGPAGWSQAVPGQHHADSNLWPQQYNAVQPQNMSAYAFPGLRNGVLNMENRQQYSNSRMPGPEIGLMGPPPVPQKQMNLNPNQQMAMGNRPAFYHPMMHPGYHPEMHRSKSHPESLPAHPNQLPQHSNFEDNSGMTFKKINNAQNSSSVPPSNWQQNGILNHMPPHSHSGIEEQILQMNPKESTGNLLDCSNMDDLVDPKVLEAQLQEMLNESNMNNSVPMSNSSPVWRSDGGKSSTSTVVPTPTDKPNTPILTQPPGLPHPQPGHNDLRPGQQTTFQSRMLHNQVVQSSSPHNQQVNNIQAPYSGALPRPEQLLPSMNPLAGQDQSKVTNMASTPSGNDKEKPKRRRRKRCGDCAPCLLKEDCGTCYVCRNKGQVNAICKARKCLILRKKAPGSDSGSADIVTNSSQGQPPTEPIMRPVLNQLNGKTGDVNSAGSTIPPEISLGNSNTEMTRQMMPSHGVSHVSGPSSSNHSNHSQSIPQSPMSSAVQSLPSHHSTMFYQQHNKFPVASHSSETPSPMAKQEQLPQHSRDLLSNSSNQSLFPITSVAEQRPGLNSQMSNNKPWMSNTKPAPSCNKPVLQKPFKPPSRQTKASYEHYNDLYSTFKDDMQKMNERTYVRANGVKVCKLMARMLALNITDEELRSSQPPKPPLNHWEKYIPESMLSSTSTSSSVATTSSETRAPCIGTDVIQAAPISNRQERVSLPDAETTNSQGTTSDLEDHVQINDCQAGVDSGFSSSSPADRQSPSPKDRFDLPTSETISSSSQPHSSKAQQNSGQSSISSDSAKHLDNESNLEHVQSTQSIVKTVKQETVDQSDTKQSLTTASFTSSSISLSNVSSCTDSKLCQPAVTSTSSIHTTEVFDTNTSDQSVTAQPQASDLEAGFASVKNVLDSLTSQIMGAEAAEVKQEDVNDSAYLLKNNKVAEPPKCRCMSRPYDENVDGPYYVHLGAAESVPAIRKLIEERTKLSGNAIRIEKIKFTTKEGRTSLGCPAAKWIVRRSGLSEKVLVIAKHRTGHYCETAWIIAAIVVWEGVPSPAANHMYDYLTRTLPVYGYETERRCGTNQPRDCACQGWDMNRKGASFSFGCSWSVYYNGCKFARSHIPRKFKLRDESFEGVIESKFQALGQHLGPLYEQMAPQSYGGQIRYENLAGDCRIGFRTGRPFSGCTATVDFCAHQHRDTHNMNNGCTVVVTLTKHRGLSKPDDEQLHALPMYVLDDTDEWGSREGLQQKINSGALEVLDKFAQEQRRRSRPYKRRKKGTETYQSPKVKAAFMLSIQEKMNNKIAGSATAAAKSASVEATKQHLFNDSLSYNSKQPNNYSQHPVRYDVSTPTHNSNNPIDLRRLSNIETFSKGFPHGISEDMTKSTMQSLNFNINQGPSHTLQQSNVNTNNSTTTTHQYQQLCNKSNQYSTNLEQQALSSLPYTAENSQRHTVSSITDQMCTSAPPTGQVQQTSVKQEGVSADNNQQSVNTCKVTVEDIEEEMTLPKPRPPSPEYDDPEGREVHEENAHLFRDPTVGGVAIALSHGAVLFEVAKRELHATTALKKPDRYNPTRISLVFYQHKRLNYKKHGYHEYQKAEEERQQARREAKAAGREYIPKGLKYKQKRQMEAAARKGRLTGDVLLKYPHGGLIRKKPGRKVGWKQKKQLRFAALQYLWPQPVNHAPSQTTNTFVSRWIKPECLVTGPYQKWLSLHNSSSSKPVDIERTSMAQHVNTTQSYTGNRFCTELNLNRSSEAGFIQTQSHSVSNSSMHCQPGSAIL